MVRIPVDTWITAEAILKSKSGRSLTSGDVLVTAENVEEYRPAPDTVTKAVAFLESAGMTVTREGITLTLRGSLEQFEKLLGVRLSLERDEATGDWVVLCFGEVKIPDFLRDVIEQIVFPEPVTFFRP